MLNKKTQVLFIYKKKYISPLQNYGRIPNHYKPSNQGEQILYSPWFDLTGKELS